MIFPQPAANHKILQMAYVVNDLEAAAERWTKTFGCGPFYILERPQVGNPLYRGQPQEVAFSTAIAQAGDLHIELVEQHCDSPSCYRDLYGPGEEGLHHLAVIAEDYASEVSRYESQGFEVAQSGTFGPLNFCYVDTSPALGYMIEVLEDKSFIRNYFDKIRATAEEWDGTRPIRNSSELMG